MSMTDPIADMLTRIRNGLRIGRPHVDMPSSKLKLSISRVLRDEGFIVDFASTEVEGGHAALRVVLSNCPDEEQVIRTIQRVSRPSRRIYRKCSELQPVLQGQGISILSTNQGVLSDREARERNVGGEVLAEVW